MQEYSINYANVLTTNTMPGVVKDAAKQMMEHGYISPGGFFRDMNDFDLQLLSGLVDKAEDIEAGQVLLMLAMILSEGEGLEVDYDPENLRTLTAAMMVFVSCESLRRKDLVEVDHSMITFDLNENLPFVRAKKGIHGQE